MEKEIQKKVVINFTEEEEKAIEQTEYAIAQIIGIMVEENADSLFLTYLDTKVNYEYDEINKIRDFLEYLLLSQNEVI